MPIFFTFLWFALLKIDLSHPETFAFFAGAAPEAPQFTCFDLVIEGAGEQCGAKLCVDRARASSSNGARGESSKKGQMARVKDLGLFNPAYNHGDVLRTAVRFNKDLILAIATVCVKR